MRTIRPYQLFTLIEAPASDRLAHVPIPQRRGAGGVSLLETFLIVGATRIVAARRLFEFGTFLGSTTLNLALNTPDDAAILTLDLDEMHAGSIQQDIADAPLTKTHLASRGDLDFIGSAVSGKITTLSGNSTTFDFSGYRRTMDFVLIDGGHDVHTVQSDSVNAFEMVRNDKPSCIMWHDYGHPDYDGLTAYLDGLANEREMYHIGDTMLCVWFHDPAGAIRAKFAAQ